MEQHKVSSKMKFIALNAYIKELETSHISNLTAHWKVLEYKEKILSSAWQYINEGLKTIK